MILKPGDDALPHMFLKGHRAPAGGTGDTNPVAEQVGVFIARQRFGFDGQPRDPGKVLDADVPFNPPNKPEGPFRFEAEIATTKPETDIVIVHRLAAFMSQAEIDSVDAPGLVVTRDAGWARIDTGSGFGPSISRKYGWLPRAYDPRLAFAGLAGDAADPTSLIGLDQARFPLPAKYFNAFNMGNPGMGAAPLRPGHRVRFIDLASTSVDVTIPVGPDLSVAIDEEPLDPPVMLDPRVDTLVFDQSDQSVTLVWRAVFPWEERFADATLEVN